MSEPSPKVYESQLSSPISQLVCSKRQYFKDGFVYGVRDVDIASQQSHRNIYFTGREGRSPGLGSNTYLYTHILCICI